MTVSVEVLPFIKFSVDLLSEILMTGFATVTEQKVDVPFEEVTVISAVPAAMVVTIPEEETVATEVLELSHANE